MEVTVEKATAYAIGLTRLRGLAEVGPDELLLGCLRSLARFGIVHFGPWIIDLEMFGIDWQQTDTDVKAKVAYSEAAVTVFDRAAHISRVDGCSAVRVEHLLVAFTDEDAGVMGQLKRCFPIDRTAWRAAAAALPRGDAATDIASTSPAAYLTPEEAAEALGIHVQTLRGYVRSGKLPALRLAGERSLRIRRSDLDKVLEPLVPDRQ